ncbi:hypothetical protein R1sor_010006 [Riccia sorocarpa]|uniref:Reverse transcriptase domain-containing protein n=1 Tax=Riccia sorocarpa TaxID=122646 RepID=A0ABD3I0Q4_9MARC
MFREEEAHCSLLGVNYAGHNTLLHQIYADDTGVNLTMKEDHFNRLKEVIQIFEEIFGAKLNLAKSLIMPISLTTPPEWVSTTGCEVAGPGKSFLYLDVSTSNPVDEVQAGIDKLETLCRHFLWGWVDLDHPKAPMIIGERISQGRKDGGLGWVPLQVKARALQVKNLMKIMMGAQAEWVHLAKSLILRTLRSWEIKGRVDKGVWLISCF